MAPSRLLLLAWLAPSLVVGTPEIWRPKRDISLDLSISTEASTSSSSAAAAASSTSVSASSLSSCLESQNVPIKLAADADWNTYAATYNTRLQNTPQVIVVPSTQQHVQDAVSCAAANGYSVQAKCGGHSYASYSTPQGGLQIDMENFQNVTLDSDGVATVDGGVRLGNLATALYDQGKRALSHGTCPGVGIGGHFLHGGYGYTSRTWGLAMVSNLFQQPTSTFRRRAPTDWV